MIVVAKKLSVLQLFISRMPKMCAILQLVSAPLNPIPIAEHFRRSHPQCEHSYGQHIYMSKENNRFQTVLFDRLDIGKGWILGGGSGIMNNE